MKNKSVTIAEIFVTLGLITLLSLLLLKNSLLSFNFNNKLRDYKRINDLNNLSIILKHLSLIFPGFYELSYASSNTVYVSLEDASPNCLSYLSVLPPLPAGWKYRCSQNPEKIDGSGWIPIPFNQFTILNMSRLPIDPINKPPYYYAFVVGSSYKLTALLEKERELAINDGGIDLFTYEVGTNLRLPTFNSGLRLLLTFNEGTGTVAYDSSGWEDHIQLNNPNSWSIDQDSGRKGLSFGPNTYGTSSQLLFSNATNEFFLGMWIKFNSILGGAKGDIFITKQSNTEGFSLYLQSKKIAITMRSGQNEQSKTFFEPSLNEWVFLAINFKKPNVKIYEYKLTSNGTISLNKSDSFSFNDSLLSSTSTKILNNIEKASGLIDGICVFNRALSDEEIETIIKYRQF